MSTFFWTKTRILIRLICSLLAASGFAFVASADQNQPAPIMVYTFRYSLIDEGKVNPSVLLDPEATEIDNNTEKRGRRLKLCLQVSPSGSYIARPCWKREGR